MYNTLVAYGRAARYVLWWFLVFIYASYIKCSCKYQPRCQKGCISLSIFNPRHGRKWRTLEGKCCFIFPTPYCTSIRLEFHVDNIGINPSFNDSIFSTYKYVYSSVFVF